MAGAVGRAGTVAGVPTAGAAAAGASNMVPYVSTAFCNSFPACRVILTPAVISASNNHARKSLLLFRLPGTASVLPRSVMLVGFAGAGVAPPAAGVPAAGAAAAGVTPKRDTKSGAACEAYARMAGLARMLLAIAALEVSQF